MRARAEIARVSGITVRNPRRLAMDVSRLLSLARWRRIPGVEDMDGGPPPVRSRSGHAHGALRRRPRLPVVRFDVRVAGDRDGRPQRLVATGGVFAARHHTDPPRHLASLSSLAPAEDDERIPVAPHQGPAHEWVGRCRDTAAAVARWF